MKILVVDSAPSVLEMFQLLAAHVGYSDVETADSGAMALELLGRLDSAFDCLIFGISVPEMGGIEFCRVVRKMESYRQTPIIVLTTMLEKSSIDQALEAGATDYLTKPLDITELKVRLRLADELSIARRGTEAERQPKWRMHLKEHGAENVQLNTAIKIEEVPKLADISSLMVYLSQLSHSGVTASQLFAIGIDRIEELYSRATPDEYLYALREVASALSSVIAGDAAIIAHCGNGVFLAVSNAAAQLDSGQIETDVLSLLDERNLEYDNGEPMSFEISVGNSIRPKSGDKNEIERSIERVIARFYARSQARISVMNPPNIRQVR